MENGVVISFPMVMSFVATTGVAFFWWWMNRQNVKDAEAAKEAAEIRQAKEQEIHKSFEVVHGRIDAVNALLRQAEAKSHDLEVKLAEAVKREEMTELRNHIDHSTQEIIKAIVGRPS